MADFQVNYTVGRLYQLRGGKLVDGFETEFFLPEFGTTHTVKTPSNNKDVVRAAILREIDAVRAIHALSEE